MTDKKKAKSSTPAAAKAKPAVKAKAAPKAKAAKPSASQAKSGRNGNSLGLYVDSVKRGDAAMQKQKFPEAVAAYKEAIEIRPEMYEGHYKLGGAYMCCEDYQPAMAAYTEAYKRDPNEMDLLLRISEICYRVKDYHRAAQMLTEVLLINDRYIPALCVLPELLVKLGRTDDAMNLLKAAIPVQPHVPELWIAAGIVAHGIGDSERAMIFYQEALNLDPKATVASHNLGMLTPAA